LEDELAKCGEAASDGGDVGSGGVNVVDGQTQDAAEGPGVEQKEDPGDGCAGRRCRQ
jgi:hypothetical protein